MYTNYNLKGSAKTIIIATIASLFIFALGSVNFASMKDGYNYVKAHSSKGEGFLVSADGLISTNYSPNYYKSQVNAVDNPNEERVKEVLHVELTGYSSRTIETNENPCIAADGTNLCKRGKMDTVAANFLEFGTKLRIPAYFDDKVFTVRDRMNSRFNQPQNSSYDGYIDIWFPGREEGAEKATSFGRVKAEVEVLE